MVRRLVGLTFIAALVVFCVVQDRVTAAGASRYARLALGAIDRHEPVAPIDSVMRPAVRQSVISGLASAGVVLIVGLAAATAASRSRRG